MAIFRYIAFDPTGKEMRGAMDAPTEQEVVTRLSARGFRQVRVVAGGGGNTGAAAAAPAAAAAFAAAAPPASTMRTPPRAAAGAAATADAGATFVVPQTSKGITWGTARPQDVALFFRQMASLVHSGYTVSAALSDLGMRTGSRSMANAAREMGAATANGAFMAPLMVRYPGLFSAHVVGLVAAGETGGFVEFAFEEIALGAEQDAALRQGLWLPKVLWWNAVWTVLLMGPLVSGINVHQLVNAGSNEGNASTGATALAVAGAFSGYGKAMTWAIPLGIALHIFCHLLGKIRHQPFARDFFDRLTLWAPVMAKLARMRALASFTRVLGKLLASGISPAPAYAGAVQSVPNAALRERLAWGLPIVRGGQGIDAALQVTGMLQHDPLQMLVTGQKTGQWLEMLGRVTAHYQEEAARATEGAKAAQRRLAWLITMIVTGYVLCAGTYGCYQIVFKIGDEMSK